MSNSVNLIAKQFAKTDEDIVYFSQLVLFLKTFPETFGWRGRSIPDLNDIADIRLVAEKYFSKKYSIPQLSTPTTIPDPIVSFILNIRFNYTYTDTERIKVEHQQSMAAENIVGDLLERYIAQNIEPLGWIWCPSSLVKHTDFIKKNHNTWVLLQIKNRDNSENSSSSAIRDGTEIIKWFRTYSLSGRTNWENFPDPIAKKLLNESKFKEFVKKNIT